jgi:putative tricarboxylic transport membrane protein
MTTEPGDRADALTSGAQQPTPSEEQEPMLDKPSAGGPALALTAGAATVLLGLVALWFSRDLGVGTMTNPGPGLWPSFVAILLLGAGAGILVSARTATDTEAFTRGAGAVAIGAASLGLYTYLFEVVGFEIPTVLLLTLWLRFLGRESWRATVTISLLATSATYVLFITGLGVPLPHLIAF